MRRCGRVTVPVWGWFSSEGAGVIHQVQNYLDTDQYLSILEDVMLPSALERFDGGPFKFLHDQHPAHTSKIVKDWLSFHEQNLQIEVLKYPPRGCDINPIEHVWADMVRELNAQNLRKKADLWDRVEDLWEEFALREDYWSTLSASMVTRLEMLQSMEGRWTKY